MYPLVGGSQHCAVSQLKKLITAGVRFNNNLLTRMVMMWIALYKPRAEIYGSTQYILKIRKGDIIKKVRKDKQNICNKIHKDF